jgi:chondroitin AC lyase
MEKNQFPLVIPTLLCLYSKTKNIVILENSTKVQAVKSKSLNISEVVFYQPGNINLGNNLILTSDSPCILMVKFNGRTIEEIAVSDPTEKLSSLQLTVNVPIKASTTNLHWDWNKEKKESTISIDLPKAEQAGKTVVMEVGK